MSTFFIEGDQREQRRTAYPWREKAREAIEHPGALVLVAKKIPRSMIISCREVIKHYNTLIESGHVRVMEMDGFVSDSGKRMADLYMLYMRDTTEGSDQ